MTVEERLEKYLGKDPQIDPTAYVSKNAVLMGDIKIGKNASVWPGCVLRADINSIELGENSNIQDGTMVHLADDAGVKIGKNTTIGHGAIIHACTIGDGCLIGEKYIVTWALGHLVTLADPEQYDEKYKKWSMETLPMLPEKAELCVIPETKKQYAAVKKLIKDKDTDCVIIATDAGREGELVARWIL